MKGPGQTAQPSPLSPQPVKSELVSRRITQTELARRLRCSPRWVHVVVNGYANPSAQFRRDVALLLDLPESALFREVAS